MKPDRPIDVNGDEILSGVNRKGKSARDLLNLLLSCTGESWIISPYGNSHELRIQIGKNLIPDPDAQKNITMEP